VARSLPWLAQAALHAQVDLGWPFDTREGPTAVLGLLGHLPQESAPPLASEATGS
jgi:hypothetical protein